MKILACLVLLCFVASVVSADIVIKQGLINPLLDTASVGSFSEIEINKDFKKLTYGLSQGIFFSQLRGEDTSGIWAVRGTLGVYPTLINLKYNIGKFYLGGAFGIAWQSFSTPFAEVKNRPMIQGIVGYKINDRLGIEVKRIFADLDIESGSYDYGIMENKSNLHSWVGALTWRW